MKLDIQVELECYSCKKTLVVKHIEYTNSNVRVEVEPCEDCMGYNEYDLDEEYQRGRADAQDDSSYTISELEDQLAELKEKLEAAQGAKED